MKIYHGSELIIENPSLEKGKPYNDYGQGFYTTLDKELAKEWACQNNTIGYVNEYVLDDSELKILDLTSNEYSLLHWIALLLKYRKFNLQNSVMESYKNEFLMKYLIDISNYDVVIGYRADDSYFSYASSFVSNSIPYSVLKKAMKLGNLGTQVVLVSFKAFSHLKYVGNEMVDNNIYYSKFFSRDTSARMEYKKIATSFRLKQSDKFILDFIKEKK